jgi:heme/copper-type cytochrome/quinol oxidase subunit 4
MEESTVTRKRTIKRDQEFDDVLKHDDKVETQTDGAFTFSRQANASKIQLILNLTCFLFIEPREMPKIRVQEVIYMHETRLAVVVRCVLIVLIFSILYYFLHPQQHVESQEDRIQRVLMEEKLRQMQKAPF